MKKRNGNENRRYFLGAKKKWGTRPKRSNRPSGFLFLLFALSLSVSYAQQTIDITATDAVNSNELVTKSQLDAVAASNSDDQTLTLTGNTLTLENGGTVDLGPITGGGTADADWYKTGTVNAPDAITDDIFTNGKLGIGTETLNYDLTIGSASAEQLWMQFYNASTGSTDNDGFYFGIDGSGKAYLYQGENNSIDFWTNGTKRMEILGNGNVNVVGDVTANAFVGDGSGLTNLPDVGPDDLVASNGASLNEIYSYNAGAGQWIDNSAANTFYDNTTSGLTATDTQSAIDEVAANGGSSDYFPYKNETSTSFTPTFSTDNRDHIYLKNINEITVNEPTGFSDKDGFSVEQDSTGAVKFDFKDIKGRYLQTNAEGAIAMVIREESDWRIKCEKCEVYAKVGTVESERGVIASWREADLVAGVTTNWTDRISGYVAVAKGGVTASSDGAGGVQFDYDGVDDAHSVDADPAALDIDPNEDMSIAFKIGTTHTDGVNFYAVKGGGGLYQYGYQRQNASVDYAWYGDDSYNHDSDPAPNDVFVITWGATNVTVYKNGTQIHQTARTSGVVTSTRFLSFASSSDGTAGFADISLKDVVVANVEWTATEAINQTTRINNGD